jgi:DNA-binding GntR family transcriptional regulator
LDTIYIMTEKLTSIHRISRQSVPEAVAESLRERILSGEFKEGDALIQDVIAQEYDTSRMPVREALRQLEAAGLVTMRLHKGAVVSGLPVEQISELFDLRAMLECDALARAIPRLTDEHLEAATRIHIELERAYQNEDVAGWGRLNWELHRTLYAPAGRVQTLAVLQSINLQVDRYIRLHLSLTRATDRAGREHRELLRLCRRRDTSRAVPYLREHILGTGRMLIVALKKNHRTDAA